MGPSLVQFSRSHRREVLSSHSFLILPAKGHAQQPGLHQQSPSGHGTSAWGFACAPQIWLPAQKSWCKPDPEPSSALASWLLVVFIFQTEVLVYLICLGFSQFHSDAVQQERKMHKYWLSLWVWWGVEVMGIKSKETFSSSGSIPRFHSKKNSGQVPKHVTNPCVLCIWLAAFMGTCLCGWRNGYWQSAGQKEEKWQDFMDKYEEQRRPPTAKATGVPVPPSALQGTAGFGHPMVSPLVSYSCMQGTNAQSEKLFPVTNRTKFLVLTTICSKMV